MKTIYITLTFLFISLLSFSQVNQGTIRGTITDKETAESLPFVKIIITQNGQQQALVTTDIDGFFKVQLPAGIYELNARFVGYETTKMLGILVKVNAITDIGCINMSSDQQMLDCVMVTYSANKTKMSLPKIQRKTTNSVASYSSENFNNQPAVKNPIYYGTSTGATVTRDDISKMSNRNVSVVASSVAGVYSYESSLSTKRAYRKSKRVYKKEQKKLHKDADEETDFVEEGGLAGQAKNLDEIPKAAIYYERYNPYNENLWVKSKEESKSTFSIDVDNASYTNFRRFINDGFLPPKEAIRVEEWLNFFNYDLNAPEQTDEHPLKIESEIGVCPWAPEDDLVMIKMQGKLAPEKQKNLPPSNLVFLVDVSGSMGSANKLPLVQKSMKRLLKSLRKEDNISIVTYAGSSSTVLEPTSGDKKNTIISAIDALSSGGGTHGSHGLITAYELAEKNLDPKGNNRVIIATDGDWNMGVIGDEPLKKLIEEKRETGIYLSVLGFGMYNLNDRMMEMLADNGNGNYAYIDTENEAKRIFEDEFAGTVHTIAKDVKIQLLFDEETVEEYRLIGYENRVLENWQFDDDAIDAGDLGMGQNVIAFYQIKRKKGSKGSIGQLDFRYKPLDSNESILLSHTFSAKTDIVSSDFNFASCVIEFALCLRESEYRGKANMENAIQRGRANLGDPANKLSYEKRVEFVGLGEDTEEMWSEYVVDEAPELEVPNKPELHMFPNPAADVVNIEVPENLKTAWSVQIFSMKGSLIKVEHFRDSQSGQIDVSNLENGTYIIKVYQAGFNFGYLKLVKS